MKWFCKLGRFLTITWVRIWGIFSCIWLQDDFVLCLMALGLFGFVCHNVNAGIEKESDFSVIRIVLEVLSWTVAGLVLVYLLTGEFDLDIPISSVASLDKIVGK